MSSWPGAQQIFKLECETDRVARGLKRAEVVYGITSLSATEAAPKRLLEIVRTHWAVAQLL